MPESNNDSYITNLERTAVAIAIVASLTLVVAFGGVIITAAVNGGSVTLIFDKFGEMRLEYWIVFAVIYPLITVAIEILLEIMSKRNN